MTDSATNSLSREKMQQILAAAGSAPAEDQTQPEATEYDWNQPHCFDNEQLQRIGNFAHRTTEILAEKLRSICTTSFAITAEAPVQSFADDLLRQITEGQQSIYYLAFGTKQAAAAKQQETKPAETSQFSGALSMPLETAARWAKQLLGDTESEAEPKSDINLSELEESLLLDFGETIIEAISEAADISAIQPLSGLTKNELPFESGQVEPLCRLTFNLAEATSEQEAKIGQFGIITPCYSLEPIAGSAGSTEADAMQSAAVDVSAAMQQNLQQIQVCLTARLASTTFTFEQLAGLQENDIVLLDKRTDEPIELVVEDRTLFLARPARSTGKYAVVITEMVSESA